MSGSGLEVSLGSVVGSAFTVSRFGARVSRFELLWGSGLGVSLGVHVGLEVGRLGSWGSCRARD